MTFTGIVNQGKIEYSDMERLHQFLLTIPGPVFVNIGKEKRIRSDKQNRYFYGLVLGLLADHTGYTTEELKQALKREFGLVKVIEINGKAIEVLKSSAELSTSEFEDFMSKIRMLATTMGLAIPEPNSPVLVDE